MCGRFSVNKDQIDDWVLERFEVSFNCETNSDLRPTQTVAALTNSNDSLSQINTSWGIKPGWSKKLIINAQGETAASKKTFKESFNSRRCLIPCSGWYEWRDEGGKRKQKYLFNQTDNKPFLMAGIWFETEGMPEIVTLTTYPNSSCAEIHKRMPVLIEPENVNFWFNSSVENLRVLIEPIASEQVLITKQ